MPSDSPTLVDATPGARARLHRIYAAVKGGLIHHLNFYKLHMIAFTLVPLVASAIFWGANGRYEIAYIDALFLCTSAMNVVGLTTLNISEATGFQQAMLMVLMILGDITVVSWLTVLVRKHFFSKRCKSLLTANRLKRQAEARAADAEKGSKELRLEETRSSESYQREADALANMSNRTGLRDRRAPTHYMELKKSPTHVSSNNTRAFRPDDFGSFPPPWVVAKHLWRAISPKTQAVVSNRITRTLTVQRTTTLADPATTPWLSFTGLRISRNSHFNLSALTSSEIEEIGGVEYRALVALAWIVAAYFVFANALSMLLIAPYLASTEKYSAVFTGQVRPVPRAWFVAFQSISLYSGGGLSLSDTGMVPFANDWYICIVWMILIAAGNMALPIFLRLVVWIIYKLAPTRDLHETLSFLLEHPRRCFLYLFPSHQTWFLLFFLVALSSFEWVSFEVLNLGLDLGLTSSSKVLVGLFQSISVRASGIGIISLSAVAPAVQFLYMICMYVAIFPVALAVRSTNVYEAKGLGVYEEDPDDEDEEPDLRGSRGEVFSKYLLWHVRRQLTMEIWWLCFGVWFILIIERSKIIDTNQAWFSVFSIIFECVSAFAGIGLSLGTPTTAFSLSGDFRKLSKLVICVLMVRGRLRGLPIAIDRAILLPSERKVPQHRKEPQRQPTLEQTLD